MMETEKGKRIKQILATDVTREQLAEALWCAERSQRMWHGCAEENRSFRLKAEDENAKLRELVLCLLTCSSDASGACDKCPVNGGAGIWEFEDFCDSLLDRVHELRIEVS